MDYQKIYCDFITDRRSKESNFAAGEYFETHHIKPKALGGDNSKSNLIKLTAEDHFFAHLLLAKIHGGKMWVALIAFKNLKYGMNRGVKISNKADYAFVRKNAAKYYRDNFSGIDSPSADLEIRTIHHFDGRIVSGYRHEILNETGITNRELSALLNGTKKNSKGWYCPKNNPGGMCRRELFVDYHSKKQTPINFYHFDGRVFYGTYSDLNYKFGIKYNKKNKHTAGWYTDKHLAETHHDRLLEKCKENSKKRGSISGNNNPRADKKIYKFVHIESGQEFTGTRNDFRLKTGIDLRLVTALMSGVQKTTNGWRVEK